MRASNTDAIVLEDGRRIKMIGIAAAGRTPQKVVERDKNGLVIEPAPEPTTTLEEEAFTFARNLLDGKTVQLEYDVESMDDGYRQAYVFLPDGTMANAKLLRQGYVYLKIRPPNVKYADQLRAAYQEGRQEQRGFLSK